MDYDHIGTRKFRAKRLPHNSIWHQESRLTKAGGYFMGFFATHFLDTWKDFMRNGMVHRGVLRTKIWHLCTTSKPHWHALKEENQI